MLESLMLIAGLVDEEGRRFVWKRTMLVLLGFMLKVRLIDVNLLRRLHAGRSIRGLVLS